MNPSTLLKRLQVKRPDLRTLAAPLVRSVSAMDRRWWRAYAAHRAHPRSKALVIRAAFGDATIFREVSSAPDAETLARICRFYETHPAFQDPPFSYRTASWHGAITSRLRQLVPNISHRDPPRFLAALLLRDAWRDYAGERVNDGPWKSLSIRDRRPLARFLQQRLLDSHTAERIAQHRGRLPQVTATWYFDTGVRALDLRNLFVFSTHVLAGDRAGGRVQNRLPLQLSVSLRLAPRSVPETAAAMDVIDMALRGLLDLDAITAQNDWMRLKDVVDGGASDTMMRFWTDCLPKQNPYIARPRDPLALVARRAGVFDSGLAFNPTRVTGLTVGRAARLERFAPYYAAVDAGALQAYLRLLAPSSDVTAAIDRARRRVPELVDGIRLRATYNALSVVLSADTIQEGVALLPSVARFALGEREPEYTGTRTRQNNRNGEAKRRTRQAARVQPLPLLVQLGIQ